MEHWVLEYDFSQYDINLNLKAKTRKREYYDKVEELIADYRKKKDALFMGCIKYNTNFKVYRATCQEIDIKAVDALL